MAGALLQQCGERCRACAFHDLPDAYLLGEAELRALNPDDQLNHVMARVRAAGMLPPDFGLAQARALMRVYESNVRAVVRYHPELYAGHITVFRVECSLTGGESDAGALGWDALAQGGVDVIDVPGDHLTMMKSPNVEVLAARLARRIQQALQ